MRGSSRRERERLLYRSGYKAVCRLHSLLAAGFLKSRLTGIHIQTAEYLCERECSTINTQQARSSFFLCAITSVSAKTCLALTPLHALAFLLPFYPCLILSCIFLLLDSRKQLTRETYLLGNDYCPGVFFFFF